MTQEIKEIVINDVAYVPKSSIKGSAPSVDGMPLVLIRGYGDGDGDGR